MKTKLLISAALFSISAVLFAQTSGGPDTFGYTWKNSLDPTNPPVYVWNDIKATGTQVTGLGDDNSVGPFNMGWNFRFYWSNYDKVTIGSNGWISFNPGGNIAAPFPNIPTATNPNNVIAPLMSDLTFTTNTGGAVPGATVWYWTNSADSFVVQYDSVPFWVAASPQYSGRYTFQVILSGVDSSITFMYKDSLNGAAPYDLTGEGLKTGIENLTGQIGLMPVNNAYPDTMTAVKFYYPNPVTYQVIDATPAWNQSTDNAGFFVSSKNSPMTMITDIENAGNQPLSNVGVSGQIFDAAFTPIWTSSATVTSLAQGMDTIINYPTSFNPASPGTFLYRTTATATGDINPANNLNDVEMVVVDTTQSSITLSFHDSIAGGQISWSGGNGGGAVEFIPPFYPATITDIEYYITSVANAGFTGEVSDDDGPNGSNGTILFSDSIAAGSVVPGQYNTINIPNPIIVTSGGFYVSWLMNGNGCALGTEGNIPLSFRNYEIIGGAWASYRGNSSEELMIRVKLGQYPFGTITDTVMADACPSNASGSATVTVTGGGAPPFTYAWAPGGQTTAVATGLAAGIYTVTITDSLGISKDHLVTVANNVTVAITGVTNNNCFGDSTGAMTASITGNTPYTYQWSNGATTAAISGLPAGTYSVVATNGDGCFNTSVDSITQPNVLALTVTVSPSTCLGNNGVASALVTGGTTSYTYAWTPGGQSTASATGLTPGGYTVQVTDSLGCMASGTGTIVSVPFTTDITGTNVSCFGGNDGTATALVLTGGTQPYTYNWSNGGAGIIATGLSGGTYSVTITDAVGCSSTETITITAPGSALSISITSNPATPPTGTNGNATAVGTGGTPPLTYNWLPGGQPGANLFNLAPGTYTACVTDSLGCVVCDSVVVLLDAISEYYNGATISISPNPFTDAAQVTVDLVEPAQNQLLFVIFDMYGKKIETIDLTNMNKAGQAKFMLNRGKAIQSGIYFYRVENETSILSAGKIMVK